MFMYCSCYILYCSLFCYHALLLICVIITVCYSSDTSISKCPFQNWEFLKQSFWKHSLFIYLIAAVCLPLSAVMSFSTYLVHQISVLLHQTDTLSLLSITIVVVIDCSYCFLQVKMCQVIHQDVVHYSQRFLDELSRYNYVTPTSYLELLGIFSRLIGIKKNGLVVARKRTKTGLDKVRSLCILEYFLEGCIMNITMVQVLKKDDG